MATPNIVPRSDSEGGLGTASKYWASAYIDNVYVGAGFVGRDADNRVDFAVDNIISFKANGANRLHVGSNQVYPETNNALSLGYATREFSDLFLGDGAVINFNNGNATITHSNDRLKINDSTELALGDGQDLKIYHDGSNTYIDNSTGIFRITQSVADGYLVLRADNGSGSPTPYLTLDGSQGFTTVQKNFRMEDGKRLQVGSSADLTLLHESDNTTIDNTTGNLTITNQADGQDIIFQCDDGSGGTTPYLTLDGGNTRIAAHKSMRFDDSVGVQLGVDADLQIFHNGTNSQAVNYTGDLELIQNANGKDIIFRSDDGAGGTATYFYLDGSSATHDGSATTALYTNWPDKSRISLGTSHDLQIYHNGTDSYIKNGNAGDLYIRNDVNDKDIIFVSDDGAGGTATYFFLDGSLATHDGSATTGLYTNWPDNSQVTLGSSRDLRLYHTGTDSIIETTGTGDLYIRQSTDDKDLIFQSDNGSGGVETYFFLDGSANTGNLPVTVFPDNSLLWIGTDGGGMRFHADGSNSEFQNHQGNLTIVNNQDDGDIIFKSDDGSGGVTEYFRLDGGAAITLVSKEMRFGDSVPLKLGGGPDLQIVHNGTDSTITNTTGNLNFYQNTDDGHIRFYNDNGSGGTTEYVRLDGSDASTAIKTIKVLMPNLPTSDPSVAGQLYIDASADRVLKVSAG